MRLAARMASGGKLCTSPVSENAPISQERLDPCPVKTGWRKWSAALEAVRCLKQKRHFLCMIIWRGRLGLKSNLGHEQIEKMQLH